MTDKFCSLLHTSLVTLSQILEITTLEDIGKYADEILQYLKTTIVLEPTESIRCVQQVLAIYLFLHRIFGEILNQTKNQFKKGQLLCLLILEIRIVNVQFYTLSVILI